MSLNSSKLSLISFPLQPYNKTIFLIICKKRRELVLSYLFHDMYIHVYFISIYTDTATCDKREKIDLHVESEYCKTIF